MEKIQTMFGEAKVGDWVMTTKDEWGYMIGKVTFVEKRIQEGKISKVHAQVDFTAYDYPEERIKETKEYLSKNYHENETAFFMENILGNANFTVLGEALICLSAIYNNMQKIKMIGDSFEASKKTGEIWTGAYKRETQKEAYRQKELNPAAAKAVLEQIAATAN